VNPQELCELQVYEGGPSEKVRVLAPFGSLPDVAAVFLRLRDNKRLIMFWSGRVVEAVA
jgi:hypothetical protein